MARGPFPYPDRKRRFNSRVEAFRENMCLTPDQLADKCGVSPSSVWLAEHGAGTNLTTAFRFAKFFGVPIEDLFEPIEE